MTPHDWREVRHHLDAVLALPPDQRQAYLAAHCPSAEIRGEVQALLAHADDPLLDSDALSRPPTAPVELLPGTTLSHYRIDRRLGAGGMGTVYLAHDEQLRRRVAIKVLKGQADPSARRRLLREARAAAALEHASICAVYDVGTDPQAGDFIVMQYVEGETLADRLARGPTGRGDALSIGRHLAEALTVAHAHGIVHRDLKPQNVIIDTRGRPHLLDFGIARALTIDDTPGAVPVTTQLTEAHAVAGTPPYMAPEQILGTPTDARGDLFSLGCILYECLTGSRAFDGQTVADVCQQVLQVDPPPPSHRRPELDPAVDALCARLLQKAPQARFQSAEDVTLAIGALEETRGGPPRERRRILWAVAAALVAAVGVASLSDVAPEFLPRLSRTALPEAPADARHWFDRGLDALRNGTYASARERLLEAIRLYPAYASAHARLAEAHSELDNQLAASQALLQVNVLVPDQSALADDDRLHLVAVRASVMRQHREAEAAYQALADRHADDVGALIDLARAQEAAGRWRASRDTLERALALDPQAAAAHLRLGVLVGRLGEKTRALAAIDEAARLYRTSGDVEGEAEALLRRGTLLNAMGSSDEAEDALGRVTAMTSDSRYVFQNLRARFEMATLRSSRGRFADAERMAREAQADATRLGLETLAAEGLIDLADALLVKQPDEAYARLERAFELAVSRGAPRTALRARLQQASLLQSEGKPGEAVVLAEAPRAFFDLNGYVRLSAQAKGVLSRAYGDLGEYDIAARMAHEVLTFAESAGDDALVATALENMAWIRAAQGLLPEALTARERVTHIHRTQGDHYNLPYDLLNHAELLVRLGRGTDAQRLLDEFAAGLAEGRESYPGRQQKLAALHALRAATEGRDDDVVASTDSEVTAGIADGDSHAILHGALASYAKARTGRRAAAPPRFDAAALLPAQRDEIAYWVARAHAERGDAAAALALLEPALTRADVQRNAELRWRLAATALLAGGDLAPRAAAWRDIAAGALATLQVGWGVHAEAYLRRADLAPLHALVR